jgi:Protein of unknown function (DUF1588)/Protein of unknown function (DUF1585)/Protein of unknown function (DUF1592)/Protein of unknown function (DUF1595)
MLKLKIELLLAVCGLVGCSGIANRTVSETGADSDAGGAGAAEPAEGGRAGATGPGGPGGMASGGVAGQDPSAGGPPTAGTPARAGCAPAPNPTAVHALSAWEYRRRVQELTGLNVATQLPPEPALRQPFAFSMSLNDLTVQSLFTEAEIQALSASVAKLLPCEPAQAFDAACAGQLVDNFVGFAFRRPLTNEERARYIGLYKLGSGGGNAAGGVSLVVQATLMSPLFLFKTYLGSSEKMGVGASVFGPYELAGRLASLFSGAGLSPGLQAEAAGGTVLSDEGVARQANQLLHEPRHIEAAQHFYAQWLGLDDLYTARADLGPELLDSMRGATDRFVADVLTGDRRWPSLLLSHDTFVDQRLAPRYNAPPPASDFVKISADTKNYFGLLTQASTLALFSNPSQRGRFVRERVLCGALPPMPPGIPTDVTVSPPQTEREAWMQALNEPSCSACHAQIDPLGFAFGHFDQDGLYRNTDNGLPIDTSGALVGVGPVDTSFQDLGDLAAQLGKSPEVAACVAGTWLGYALERPLGDGDACALMQIEAAFAGSNFNLDALLTAIVRSTPFRTRDAYEVPQVPPPTAQLLGAVQDPQQRRKILLDFSVTEAMWLGQIVPPEDRSTLDQYVGLLRDLEKSLGQL